MCSPSCGARPLDHAGRGRQHHREARRAAPASTPSGTRPARTRRSAARAAGRAPAAATAPGRRAPCALHLGQALVGGAIGAPRRHVGRQRLAVLAAAQVVLEPLVVDAVRARPIISRPALELVRRRSPRTAPSRPGCAGRRPARRSGPRLWVETRLTPSIACSMSVALFQVSAVRSSARLDELALTGLAAVHQRGHRRERREGRGREVDVRHRRRATADPADRSCTCCPTPPGRGRRSRPCGSTRRPDAQALTVVRMMSGLIARSVS